jgi:DNA-binding NarL/FixJ family response regulator
VLLVEDEPWIRESVAGVLDAPAAGLELAAACGSAEQALEQLRGGLAADAALVDIGLPGASGIELVGALRARWPAVVSVMFTVFDDAPTVLRALRAGARGYLLKSTPLPRLRDGLVEALDGGAPMTPAIARLVVDELAGARPSPSGEADGLTPRERDVLQLLAKGLTYGEVATALGIAIGTVQSYVKTIYAKLHVASKAEAASLATRLGLA